MSIWGKIIGGAAGFAFGGPIGGLLGALAGHAVDSYVIESQPNDTGRDVAFTIALIALSAKMAKADGHVTRDEILAFRQRVDIPAQDVEDVSRLWDLARQTPDGFDGYARQLASMFPAASPILDQLMDLLFYIARADGEITEVELDYLKQVADILGYDEQGFDRLCLIYGDPEANPYHVLGVNPDDSDNIIRQAWINLARNHHPDALMAAGLPEEFIRAASERLAKINTAYDDITRMRQEAVHG
ncbi:MAG: molecular chaperone DjiA [Alphaproteobacteria bacterium]|jgi:DnaJ like chaperone protein|nr:molecular chaperone DjiA [Alphaproteobacteria bacterium]